jgi:hypothetical protein
LLACRKIARIAAFHAVQHQVLDADVGEGAAHHHAIVAAPRAVLIEVFLAHAARDQILPGRAIDGDIACRRDVIGRDRIAQQQQHARIPNVAERRHVNL